MRAFNDAVKYFMARGILLGAIVNFWHCTPGATPDDDPMGKEMDQEEEVGTADPGTGRPLTWALEDIDPGSPDQKAGFHGQLLRASDGTLHHLYLSYVGTVGDGTCDIAVFAGGEAPAIQYDLKLATRDATSGVWSNEVVDLSPVPATDNQAYVGSLFGLHAVIDSNDRIHAVFAGGGPGVATCASSDLVYGIRETNGTWAFSVPVEDSSACCSVDACNGEPACTSGTDVGAWATLALSGSDVAVAYVDYHFFWDQDGQTHQGLELWENSGVTGIRPWSGLGAHSALSFLGGTLTAVTTGFNGGGLHYLRRTGSTGLPADDWVGSDLMPGAIIGERVQLAEAADGSVGLAFHVIQDRFGSQVNDLVYCRSNDSGATLLTPCEDVDRKALHVGANPDLAFLANHQPVMSYYYCGATGTCPASGDGFRYAERQADGTWATYDVHNVASGQSGAYGQVVIDPSTDLPILVFQDTARGALVAATGELPQ